MTHVFTEAEAQRMCAAAVQAAHDGGAVLQDWIGRFSVREKSRADLVTEADEASQAVIVESLRRQFPSHGFLGEENLKEVTEGDQPCWIIDPLDGTSNYVHGFPYYAVSVALVAAGDVQVGAIFDPTRNETFHAVAGQGAFLGDQRLQTSGTESRSMAMGMASLPIAASAEDPAVQRFLRAMTSLQTVQRTGSAALNLAYVAAGRIDTFWSSSLHAWDIAAGVLLVQEAQGVITDLTGGRIDIFKPSLLAASTKKLHQELVTVLA
jgi:myo-inositol-1(or 4)-monophosphatase